MIDEYGKIFVGNWFCFFVLARCRFVYLKKWKIARAYLYIYVCVCVCVFVWCSNQESS